MAPVYIIKEYKRNIRILLFFKLSFNKNGHVRVPICYGHLTWEHVEWPLYYEFAEEMNQFARELKIP